MKSTQNSVLLKKGEGAAFTLVELLSVLAIVGLILLFAVPSVTDVIRAGDLSNGATALVSTLSAARQTAIVQNRNVEVRIYRYVHPVTENREFHAMQSFVASDETSDGWKAVGRVQSLPDSVLLDESSSLIQSQLSGLKPGSMPIRSNLTSYDYVYFTFRPDGSTDLGGSAGQQYLLLCSARGGGEQSPLPQDFFIIDVAPRWGQVRLYGR